MTNETELDLSWITKWFRGNSKKQDDAGSAKEHATSSHEHKTEHKTSHETNTHKPHHEEETTLDIGNIGKRFKGIFKGDKADSKGKDDSVDLDPKKIWNTIVKYNAVIFILIAILCSAYLRSMPWEMPITDNWAKDTIHNSIKSQIGAQISQRYPHLNAAQRNELIQSDFQNYLKNAGTQLDEQIKGQSEYFKSRFRTPEGDHMLLDIDSYAYYRETWNDVTYGHLGNAIINGTPWDTFVLAPLGIPPGDNFHIHLGAWMYKLWHALDPSVTLLKTMFWLPFLIALITPIPAFFIGRKFAGPIGGFFAALYVAINPGTLARTSAGVPDTDVYSIVFPLLILWAYLETYDAKTSKSRFIWTILAGFFTGLYAWAWSGWWHVFFIALGGTGAYMVMSLAINYRAHKLAAIKSLKATAMILGLYIVATAAFVSAFRDVHFFLDSVNQPFHFMVIQQAAKESMWPNVYTTVAELNTVDIKGIVGSIGGWTYAIIALIGAIFAMSKKDEHGFYDFKFGLILLMWIAATVYASTKGVRFLMLLTLPFTICLASFVGNLSESAGRWLKRTMNVPFATPTIAVILFAMFIASSTWAAAVATSQQNIPLINDAWWTTLTNIKDKSEPNAILTSWWDFGHWFKSIAQRPTTFDGGTQNTPIAHWVGKMLLTGDEDEAMGILKMLNCGSNNAAVFLEEEFNGDTVRVVDLLYRIIKMDEASARAELVKNGVKNPDRVVQATHCKAPESFVIASDDMIGKGGVWAHFGSWNFTRAQIYINIKNMSRKQAVEYVKGIGVNPDDATRLVDELKSQRDDRSINTWISPWPGYGGSTTCRQQNGIIRCQNGVEINMTDHSVNQVNNGYTLKRLSYVENGEFKSKEFRNSINDLDAVLLPSTSIDSTLVVTQYPLGTSLFTRLYYLQAVGLSHFDKFDDQTSVTGGRVITYKVDWSGTHMNMPYGNITKPAAAAASTAASKPKAKPAQ